MWNCKNCGTALDDSMNQCPACGYNCITDSSENVTNYSNDFTSTVVDDDKLYCPVCGSTHLNADKKGFGAGKAIAGAALTGGIGLLAGFIGSGKVKITCLKCGAKLEPGQLRTTPLPPKREMTAAEQKKANNQATIIGIISFIFFILFLYKCV